MRGIEEHDDLCITDIKIRKDRDGLELFEYIPCVGKTYKGGINDRRFSKGR